MAMMATSEKTSETVDVMRQPRKTTHRFCVSHVKVICSACRRTRVESATGEELAKGAGVSRGRGRRSLATYVHVAHVAHVAAAVAHTAVIHAEVVEMVHVLRRVLRCALCESSDLEGERLLNIRSITWIGPLP